MKIITWNCNGGFRSKLEQADSLKADILIVQECENPAHSTQSYRDWAGKHLWIGSSKHKGIGVFPKNGHSVAALDWHGEFHLPGVSPGSTATTWTTQELELFLPFSINGRANVLAVWTKGGDKKVFRYIGQFWKFLQIHRQELSQPRTMIIGDFNSNTIWDRPDRWWNHSDVVTELEAMRIKSLYHNKTGEAQGSETTPTFFLHRNPAKPYHIDYAFLSEDLIGNSGIEIGCKADWLVCSDHMPLSIDVQD
jgi:endonuclease/exonuclease/phosphatase family metal-dependent hydrolase